MGLFFVKIGKKFWHHLRSFFENGAKNSEKNGKKQQVFENFGQVLQSFSKVLGDFF